MPDSTPDYEKLIAGARTERDLAKEWTARVEMADRDERLDMIDAMIGSLAVLTDNNRLLADALKVLQGEVARLTEKAVGFETNWIATRERLMKQQARADSRRSAS